jgi:transcription initiation factor TFIID TATA-box-binding protein
LTVVQVVLLIFVSGRIIVTGAKTRRDIEIALEKVHPILLEYRKLPQLGEPPAKRRR